MPETMNTAITPAKSRFRGVTYRSMTDANFARWCQEHSQTWLYFDNGLFLLLVARMIIEVAQPFDDNPHIIDELSECWVHDERTMVLIEHEPFLRIRRFTEYDNMPLEREQQDAGYLCGLGFCFGCGILQICGNGSWACPNCGYYEGNAGIPMDLMAEDA